jgi:LysR family transcriptional regulator, hydrogen peroxide-inducible genes activator
MNPLPTPQQLRYLLALAEHGHFGRAAEACAVSQSTLSAGLLALERQLDARLLDRSAGKRVVFTPLGHEVLGRARAALAALEAVAETAAASRAPMSGPLRLGVIPTIGPFLLPRLMPALRAAFPRLRLFLREDLTPRLIDGLLANRLDVLLLALPCECDPAETMAVGRDEFVLALPPGNPLAALDRVPASALAGERVLLLEEGHCMRDQALAACGGVRGEGFAATSLHTLVQMVAGGLGVTLLPRLALEGGVAQGAEIALRPLEGRGAWRTLGLAWRPNAPRAADYRALAPVIARAANETLARPSDDAEHGDAEQRPGQREHADHHAET